VIDLSISAKRGWLLVGGSQCVTLLTVAARLAFLLLLACLQVGVGAETTRTQPNVLFLAVDDMNDWVGFLGGYPARVFTPNIDRLAGMGTAFTNAHTAAPVCCPSRAAVMSGLLPTTSGIYNNQQWWKPHRPELVTLPIHFRQHGYTAVGAGKIYHHTAGNNPPSQWDDYHRLLFNDNAWIRAGSPLYPYTKPKPRPKEFPFCGLKNYSEEVDWGVLPGQAEGEYDDAVTVDYAIRFLESDDSRAKPFFLACGTFHPHLPWYVPQKYLDLYPLENVVVPAIDLSDLDDVPEPGRKLALRKADNLREIREAGKWQSAIRHYLASISFADAQIGRVLESLEESPHADNTVIVLWSDHGWHLGEKGHWHKRTLWEEATRVPLIVVAPGHGKPGQRCQRPASLIDLYPTLIDICGLSQVPGLDGVSLVRWLNHPEAPRDQPAIIVEESGHVAARSDQYRYIRYRDGSEELYDHLTDPQERTNLADRDEFASIKLELAARLPIEFAKPAATKGAYRFDPQRYSWTHRRSGKTIRGK
jgi:choline-sulfatase